MGCSASSDVHKCRLTYDHFGFFQLFGSLKACAFSFHHAIEGDQTHYESCLRSLTGAIGLPSAIACIGQNDQGQPNGGRTLACQTKTGSIPEWTTPALSAAKSPYMVRILFRCVAHCAQTVTRKIVPQSYGTTPSNRLSVLADGIGMPDPPESETAASPFMSSPHKDRLEPSHFLV
jgi:hypothetical protein